MSNHLGSTDCIYPLTGAIRTPIAQQVTDAYGVPVTLQGAVDPQRSRTSFIGRDVDKESDLGAFGARLYSSEYGRFVAVDKLWEEYPHLGVYQYCRNCSLMSIDPTGLGDDEVASKPVREAMRNSGMITCHSPKTPAYEVDIQGNRKARDDAYNCHSYAWSDAKGDPSDPINIQAMKDNQSGLLWDNDPKNNMKAATKLDFNEPNIVGDRVVYFKADENGNVVPTHSAIVEAVDANEKTTMASSKFGEGCLIMHHPRDIHDLYGVDHHVASNLTTGRSYATRVYYRVAPDKRTTFANIIQGKPLETTPAAPTPSPASPTTTPTGTSNKN